MTRTLRLPVILSACAIAAMVGLAAFANAQPVLADDSADASAPPAVDMHRLYNPNSGEHFYTADTVERDGLIALGWRYEGVGWRAPVDAGDPVFRLYNPNAGEHHYTLDEGEKSTLVAAGWNDEGVGWLSDATAGGIPVYREYNPNAYANNHNYTASRGEHAQLVSSGWNDEGSSWAASPSTEISEPDEKLYDEHGTVIYDPDDPTIKPDPNGTVRRQLPYHEEWHTVTDTPAWDENVYEYVPVGACNICGLHNPSEEHLQAHEAEGYEDVSVGTAFEQVLVDVIHHEAVTHQELVKGYW